MTTIEIPTVLPSAANTREHYRAKAGRVKKQRSLARDYVTLAGVKPPPKPHGYTVTMVRRSSRALDDDNLQYAFKAIRDGIADALGVDDRTPLVVWKYAQEKAKTPMLRITIEENQ